LNLSGKTALVTGGAVRIGRAICEELASKGCNIVIHYNHSVDDAKLLATKIKSENVNSWLVKGDLSAETGCKGILKDAERKAGRIHILVNNAAVFHKDGLMSSTDRKLKAEIEVNLLAPMMLMKEFARMVLHDCKGEGDAVAGKVINLLDRRIAGAEVGCLPYLLSKKMLAELTRSAALELAPYITVNGVAPGAILPPPVHDERTVGGKGAKDRVRDLAGKIPMKFRCSTGDVAKAVVFMLESDALTGQVIFVDGGQHLVGTVADVS